jgi:hypothetical protein
MAISLFTLTLEFIMSVQYPEEKNKFKRAFIWIWYNDVFRLICMMGVPVLPVFISMVVLGFPIELVKTVTAVLYVLLIGVLWLFNDYSNLRRIGMDEYRKRLK